MCFVPPAHEPFSSTAFAYARGANRIANPAHSRPLIAVKIQADTGGIKILIVACSGTGYIGSFTALVLLENDYDVVIVDNLYNSSKVALDRIELICGKRPVFYQVDVTDEAALDDVFAKHPAIDSVIHFAALKVRSLLHRSAQAWLDSVVRCCTEREYMLTFINHRPSANRP